MKVKEIEREKKERICDVNEDVGGHFDVESLQTLRDEITFVTQIDFCLTFFGKTLNLERTIGFRKL
jgi:hypothetical protein